MLDPGYENLFQPTKTGPLTAKNQFHQVHHCNGGDYRDPSTTVATRRRKAEDDWRATSTEQCEMHHISAITPFIELRHWVDQEAPEPMAWLTNADHRYARELDDEGIGNALPFRNEIREMALD